MILFMRVVFVVGCSDKDNLDKTVDIGESEDSVN